jgi:hypothetical protein
MPPVMGGFIFMNKPTIIVPNIRALYKIFENDPPSRSGLNQEKLLYIISFVFNHQMKSYESDYGDDDYAVTISSKMFQSILGRTYKRSFDYLCNNGILELVSKHFSGVTCRKYVLRAKFSIEPSFYTIKNFAFGKTLKGRLNKKEKIKYPYFNKWLKLIEFDTEYATVFNNLLFESRKNYLPFQTISKKNRIKLSNPLNQFTHGQTSILKLQNKYDKTTIDEKGMRLHSALTSCPKLLRNFITIGGQHLVSIDLKNSQPYMLLALLDPNNFKKKSDAPNPHLPIPTSLLSTYNIPSIILRHSSIIQYSKEFQEYKMLVTSGKIYDDFVKLTQIDKKELDNGFSKRNIVKFRFMLCFYSANNANSQGMKTLFRSKFPKIYALMCDLKQKDHSTLSILLQRVESTLVLDKICGRISSEFPKIPLFTIHDSILTTPNNVEYVKSIIEEECEKYIGIAPMLSIEPCSPKENKKLLEDMDKELVFKFQANS